MSSTTAWIIYTVVCLALTAVVTWASWTPRRRDPWEYGCAYVGDGRRLRARRHKEHGKVQFVLWRAGEQGHTTDYWYDMHHTHWPTFVRDET